LALRGLFLVAVASCPHAAMAQAEMPTLVLEVLPDAAEIDAAALRQGVAAELAIRVVAPSDRGAGVPGGTFTVGIDREKNELVVEFRRRGAGPLTRRLPLPIERSVLQQTVVFLAGNMARDESQDVLRHLGTDAVVPSPSETTAEPRPSTEPLPAPPEPARREFWIGLSAEAALGWIPAGSNVCGQDPTTYASTSGFYCVTHGGQDYAPANPTQNPLIANPDTAAGLGFASSRFTLSFDYALRDNWLVGGRFGIAVDRYPGNAGGLRGKTWGPTHLELRATYVLGEHPLVRSGVRLAVTVGAGVAEWDTKIAIAVGAGNPPSPLSVDAWRVEAGPFLSGAIGPRIALGERTAILVNAVKLTAVAGAISRTDAMLLLTPELGVQVGF
jgi:hypothetical protein